jgi:uncharacterized protein YndB with AHSA1/START domain
MSDGIAITRVFDAPRELVWKAFTEPDRFTHWFGPREAELANVSMDVRPGGEWSATMRVAGREIPWSGTYHEVTPPERLVFTIKDDPEITRDEFVTVVLNDLGDGRTEMHFTQRGGGLPPEGYEQAKQGWGGFFERMAEHLAD